MTFASSFFDVGQKRRKMMMIIFPLTSLLRFLGFLYKISNQKNVCVCVVYNLCVDQQQQHQHQDPLFFADYFFCQLNSTLSSVSFIRFPFQNGNDIDFFYSLVRVEPQPRVKEAPKKSCRTRCLSLLLLLLGQKKSAKKNSQQG